MNLLVWQKKEWCDSMDRDLYVVVLKEILERWEELGMTGKQKSQLESIALKISNQIKRGER